MQGGRRLGRAGVLGQYVEHPRQVQRNTNRQDCRFGRAQRARRGRVQGCTRNSCRQILVRSQVFMKSPG